MTTIGATRDFVTRPPAWAYAWWLVVGVVVLSVLLTVVARVVKPTRQG